MESTMETIEFLNAHRKLYTHNQIAWSILTHAIYFLEDQVSNYLKGKEL